MRQFALIAATTSLCFAGLVGGATAETTAPAQETSPSEVGGLQFGAQVSDGPTAPGSKATVDADGTARAPENAPDEVKKVIWAANKALGTPYVYGGGHKDFSTSGGLDCSGAVSFALNGGNFLDSPLDSSAFGSWGEEGKGEWITVYTNPGHAYLVVAGVRWDTSRAGSYGAREQRRRGRQARSSGISWQTASRPSGSFEARHPAGF